MKLVTSNHKHNTTYMTNALIPASNVKCVQTPTCTHDWDCPVSYNCLSFLTLWEAVVVMIIW